MLPRHFPRFLELENMSTSTNWKPRTLAAQALGRIDETTRAVVPPIHVATTFIRDPDNQYPQRQRLWPAGQ